MYSTLHHLLQTYKSYYAIALTLHCSFNVHKSRNIALSHAIDATRSISYTAGQIPKIKNEPTLSTNINRSSKSPKPYREIPTTTATTATSTIGKPTVIFPPYAVIDSVSNAGVYPLCGPKMWRFCLRVRRRRRQGIHGTLGGRGILDGGIMDLMSRGGRVWGMWGKGRRWILRYEGLCRIVLLEWRR
jgi:hypothetical protein